MDKHIPKFTDEVLSEILVVRDTGEVNMFDINGVMRVAYENDLFQLVEYLSDKRTHGEYQSFILSGKRPVR